MRYINMSLEKWTAVLARVPLQFHPGERYLYSVGIDVCGRLIEVLSGMTLSAYLQKYVFRPLGMHDTGFFVPEHHLPRLTQLYFKTSDKSLHVVDKKGKDSVWGQQRPFESGGGGLVSSMYDYYRFATMQLDQGQAAGGSVLAKKTHQRMVCNHFANHANAYELGYEGLVGPADRYLGYGLGLGCFYGPDDRVQRFGWRGAANTNYWVDPNEELVVVYMQQLMPSGAYPIRDEILQMVYGSVLD